MRAYKIKTPVTVDVFAVAGVFEVKKIGMAEQGSDFFIDESIGKRILQCIYLLSKTSFLLLGERKEENGRGFQKY